MAQHAPGGAYENPLSAELASWLLLVQKTLKTLRVYAQNNALLSQFLDDSFARMTSLLERVPELSLSVREDRLLFGKDAVLVDVDRESGIPMVLYRNAFRRLTLLQGMTRDELVQLLLAIATDLRRSEVDQEDLVSVFWRMNLPHLRYVAIDSMAIAAPASKGEEDNAPREDLERMQVDVEHILAKLYQTSAADDDMVAGLSISKEDLEAFQQIRGEAPEDVDLLDVATNRAIADIPPAELQRIQVDLAKNDYDNMLPKMIDILVDMLVRQNEKEHALSMIHRLTELFDTLIQAHRWPVVAGLIQQLRARMESTDAENEIVALRGILVLFAAETRILPVLVTLNDDERAVSLAELADLLRILGWPVVPALVKSLEMLSSATHRRMICDLIIELGTPPRDLLLQEFRNTQKWFVARDLLSIAQRLPPDQLALIAFHALSHEHPRVRSFALSLLRPYPHGRPDTLIAERIMDVDLEVRMAAIRVAAARKSVEALPHMEAVIRSEDLEMRDPREIRLVMAAYAAIGGAKAVPALEQVLSKGFFAQLKDTESRVAAIYALAAVGDETATQAIKKASRTINADVREACRRALANEVSREHQLDHAGDRREE